MPREAQVGDLRYLQEEQKRRRLEYRGRVFNVLLLHVSEYRRTHRNKHEGKEKARKMSKDDPPSPRTQRILDLLTQAGPIIAMFENKVKRDGVKATSAEAGKQALAYVAGVIREKNEAVALLRRVDQYCDAHDGSEGIKALTAVEEFLERVDK